MTDTEYARKLDELDRLLNDPEVPMEPVRIWALLAEIADRGQSLKGQSSDAALEGAEQDEDGWFH